MSRWCNIFQNSRLSRNFYFGGPLSDGKKYRLLKNYYQVSYCYLYKFFQKILLYAPFLTRNTQKQSKDYSFSIHTAPASRTAGGGNLHGGSDPFLASGPGFLGILPGLGVQRFSALLRDQCIHHTVRNRHRPGSDHPQRLRAVPPAFRALGSSSAAGRPPLTSWSQGWD